MNSLLHKQLPAWVVLLLVALAFGISYFALTKAHAAENSYTVEFAGNATSTEQFAYGSWPALSNTDFFDAVKNSLVASSTSFIEANLSTMQLSVYEKGVVVKQVPILTIGREGSWWETPGGIYKVDEKIPKHFSSLGHVYTDWNLPFQGNFFIHGWPYYPDGTPVSTTYSGGCIRLSTADAKTVYDMATVGEPILVFTHALEPDTFTYAAHSPTITADAYLAVDLENNYVFISHNASEIKPIASLTKLMTALVATDYINIEKTVTVPADDIVPTSKPRLVAGQSVSVYDLLFPLLEESSNEAADVIGDMLGKNYFVSLMNEKAKAVGMNSTTFVDPSGAEDGNTSSAEDLFALAKYLYGNRKFILEVSDGKVTDQAYGPPQFTGIENFNVFSSDPEFVGGKVGETTAAKETIISIFNIPVGGEVRPIAFIALGSSDNGADVRAMKQYVEDNFSGSSAVNTASTTAN